MCNAKSLVMEQQIHRERHVLFALIVDIRAIHAHPRVLEHIAIGELA